ncbi:hypothetical protein SSP531S_23340 [Streptomyces spongiicola]|uniref:Uncharacterized protein n=1 Tax=Streptomyces spongiicola TaxID=1690221 RepID=A0A388SYS2_9ACTN|nr:hypothetical protein SSP531S_23340 [Streptomyces spongiicola]
MMEPRPLGGRGFVLFASLRPGIAFLRPLERYSLERIGDCGSEVEWRRRDTGDNGVDTVRADTADGRRGRMDRHQGLPGGGRSALGVRPCGPEPRICGAMRHGA